MTAHDVFLLILKVLGGMALFIFGMNIMTEGLRAAAGGRLRSILSRATRNRVTGILVGVLLGFLAHSGATTAMFVGLMDAGLMALAECIPPILGANIGTTLSMQLVSLQLGDYCFLAIAGGFLLRLTAPQQRAKDIGSSILGFGLLFLGMGTISAAVAPHKDLIAPYMGSVHGYTLGHMLLGIALSTLFTAAVASSGATIGMCFALISAGVFTSLEQVYPVVLGAHIGTCIVALLAGIGTNIEARRSAMAHLLFNVFNVLIAVLLAPLFIGSIRALTTDLIHQTANLHTLVMLVGALIVLPLSPQYARLIRRITPSKEPIPELSHLREELLIKPETAICAALLELQRVARICADSMRLNAELLFEYDGRKAAKIKLNEKIVDEIKLAMRDYLRDMTRRYLSSRQSILIQHLDHCMIDIERIGDHIDSICERSVARLKSPAASFDPKTMKMLFALYEAARNVLLLVIDSLNPEGTDFHAMARKIIKAGDAYTETSMDVRATCIKRLDKKKMPPISGIFMNEYISAFDRLVKHARSIALAEREPQFWIKRKKLDRVADEAPDFEPPPAADARKFLDRLLEEDEEKGKGKEKEKDKEKQKGKEKNEKDSPDS